MKYIKKYWFIILVLFFSVLRFLLSYKLPSFAIVNLKYDDLLIVNILDSLRNGNYLGDYSMYTLVKGSIYPIVLYYSYLLRVTYSFLLSFLYVVSCLYLLFGIKKIINNKIYLLLIYIVLLFNPISYSGEVFQRLYITSISIIELMIFLGVYIRLMVDKEEDILNYIIFGIISIIMLLTRNDNIWIYLSITILGIFKLYKKFSIRRLINVLIPIIIIVLGFNIVSFVNYKHYNIYTYNELESSSFSKAYKKILQIKDDNKTDNISVPITVFYKLCDNSKVFDFTKEEIDDYFDRVHNVNEEVDNGNVMWFIRDIIYNKYNFKDGKEADDYFDKLSNELDQLFDDKVLEKEMSLPIVYINVPRLSAIKKIPRNLVTAIGYTTSYKNVRTYTSKELLKMDDTHYIYQGGYYEILYNNYRYAEDMIVHNPLKYEIIRNIYKYLTIIFSIISISFYIINIKKKDDLNVIIHFILLLYIIIIGGVVYTHVTAFHAIRYRYLANVYILQSLFILLNMSRLLKETGEGNGFSNNTSIQRRKSYKKNNKGNTRSIKRK